MSREILCSLQEVYFWVDSVLFLGYIILTEGIYVDKSKIEAIHDWLSPTVVTEARSFRGLAYFY